MNNEDAKLKIFDAIEDSILNHEHTPIAIRQKYLSQMQETEIDIADIKEATKKIISSANYKDMAQAISALSVEKNDTHGGLIQHTLPLLLKRMLWDSKIETIKNFRDTFNKFFNLTSLPQTHGKAMEKVLEREISSQKALVKRVEQAYKFFKKYGFEANTGVDESRYEKALATKREIGMTNLSGFNSVLIESKDHLKRLESLLNNNI